MKNIYFDMDGTIANLYGEPNWLENIVNENTEPYENAKPLLSLSALARRIHKLEKNGYQFGIISWTAKGGTEKYNQAVKLAKVKWLKKHLPSVQFELNIVEYGTPKSTCGNGILFDDEKPNRDEWNGTAYDEKNILEILKNLA